MLFWIVSAVITAAAAVALVGPLFGSRKAVSERDSEIAIYRDQLAEIDRDVERGVLPEGEAESARTEIARRLLRAGEAKEEAVAGGDARRRAAMWVAIVVIPAVALGGYLALGEPGVEDQPIAERRANPSTEDLFARFEALAADPTPEAMAELSDAVEAALERDPDNATVLQMAASMRFSAERFGEAAAAYLGLLDVVSDPANFDERGDFGAELGFRLLTSEGPSDQTAELIRRVAAAFPANDVALLNLGLLREAEGDNEGAIEVYQRMIEREPPGGGPWSDLVRELLADLGVEAPPVDEAAPADEAMAPILEMTPEEQMAFIEEMVGQLAARLEDDPNDPEGWARLITSYIVLEREDDAAAALEQAREVFTGNAEALQLIEEAAAPLTEQQ